MDKSYESRLAAGVEKKYRELEIRIMQDVVRRISESKKITSTADWQLTRYRILGNSSRDIEEMVRSTVGGDYVDTFKLYDRVLEELYVRSRELYEQVNEDITPFDRNEELKQLTDALIQQSNEELYNITKSAGFKVDMGNGRTEFFPLADYYNKYLDAAVMDIATGAFDYNSTLRRVVTQMANSGLRTTEYASGRTARCDVAARRAVMTGLSQLTGHVSDMNAKKLGTEYFEVAWHAGARPTHREWQGKVWSRQELYDVCGLGTVTGLLGVNCYHEYYPFILGVSKRLYSDEWLKEQNRKEDIPRKFKGREYTLYEATQHQRYMETCMRAQREKAQLLQQGGADPEEVVLARCKYQAQLDEYKAFSKKMGLKEQRERIYYDMRGRVAPERDVYLEYKAKREEEYQQWLHDIGAKGLAPRTRDAYEEAKANKTIKYVLLNGYAKAVKKGDISPLVGLKVYRDVANDIRSRIIGQTTPEGVKIESMATHFIDRIIGQSSTPHSGKREGVPIENALDAIINPKEISTRKTMADGDVRQTLYGARASVAISVRDGCLIQTTPRGTK